jgi:acyl carrier protein
MAASEACCEVPIEDTVRAVISNRMGGSDDYAVDTELTALGIDSLMLLRIIADLAVDPRLEIDPVRLADVATVADLRDFLAALTEGADP